MVRQLEKSMKRIYIFSSFEVVKLSYAVKPYHETIGKLQMKTVCGRTSDRHEQIGNKFNVRIAPSPTSNKRHDW